VGTCVVKENKRTIFYLVTKKQLTNTPSYETFTDFLKELRDLCNKKQIKMLALPKHGAGLDKLNWDITTELINRILIPDIKENQHSITLYFNYRKSLRNNFKILIIIIILIIKFNLHSQFINFLL
jgi:hypothetical protein